MHSHQLGAEFPSCLRHCRDQSLSERHNIAMALHSIAGGEARQHMPIARHLPSTSAIRTRDRHEQSVNLNPAHLHGSLLQHDVDDLQLCPVQHGLHTIYHTCQCGVVVCL